MSNPDIAFFDPPAAYADANPPAAFLRDLKALDPNLAVAWHVERQAWALAEIKTYPVVETSDVLVGPDGAAAEKSRTPRRIAIEFGFEAVLGPDVIARIRRYSPKFQGRPAFDDYEAAMRAASSRVKADEQGRSERAEASRPAWRWLTRAFGAPLKERVRRSRLGAKIEREKAASRARAFRQVVSPAGRVGREGF